jgi:hypothetical protein
MMHDWNNAPTQQRAVFYDETEVTNSMYLDYLDWLKSVYPPTEENYKTYTKVPRLIRLEK